MCLHAAPWGERKRQTNMPVQRLGIVEDYDKLSIQSNNNIHHPGYPCIVKRKSKNTDAL
jgi:hypothetical protein